MFDFGFSELLLIGVVALVVIGPERLPKVARTAGHLFGRMQRYVADVKADINREIQVEELKKLQEEMHASVNSIENAVKRDMQAGSEALKAASEQVHEIVELPRQQEPPSELNIADTLPPIEDPVSQLELDLGVPDLPDAGHVQTEVKENKHV